MQVQPCGSAWRLRGCVLNCANTCNFACPWDFRGCQIEDVENVGDIVACLELSVHWVPSCFDMFWLFCTRLWGGGNVIFSARLYEFIWMIIEFIDVRWYWPSKTFKILYFAQRLDLDVDLAFFRQGHNNWNTESRHLGSQMRFDDDIRILRYLEDTSPGKLIHTVARGSNSGLPLSTGKVLSLKHRKWRSSSSICWLQLSVLACIEKDEKVGQKLITAS